MKKKNRSSLKMIVNKKYVLTIYMLALILLIASIISCDKNIFKGITEIEKLFYGEIFLDSNPDSALIYVDNKNSGYFTPDTIKWLESGTHTITLKKYLFQDTSFIVDIKDKEFYSLFIDFTLNSKNFGKIDCTSEPPGSNIYINDSLTNKTAPAVLQHIYPGYYEIKYTQNNYKADSLAVLVKSSETVNAFIILEDTTKWVSYNTQNSKILSNYVSAVAVDNENDLWDGTFNNGLAKLKNY